VSGAFCIETIRAGDQFLRVGRHAGSANGPPLLMFNGIGGNIELLEPFARLLRRESIIFDVPGVGHSPLPAWPYQLRSLVRLAGQVLDEYYGHEPCDVLGISWGGAPAQEFARREPKRCRRLVLCATATGSVMLPARPGVLWKMATPRRYLDEGYILRIAGDIYGGDFRRDPLLAEQIFRHIRWQSRLGYYLQLFAAAGWTSIPWLHSLRQPALLLAGADDPLVPLFNARLMCRLMRDARLDVLDCGHLFLLTRAEKSARLIEAFLDRE